MDDTAKRTIIDELNRGAPIEEACARAGVTPRQVAEARIEDRAFDRDVGAASTVVRRAVRRRIVKAALEGNVDAAARILDAPAVAPDVVDGTYPRHGLSSMRGALTKAATARLVRRLNRGR